MKEMEEYKKKSLILLLRCSKQKGYIINDNVINLSLTRLIRIIN